VDGERDEHCEHEQAHAARGMTACT
jgi:hypothetical protein